MFEVIGHRVYILGNIVLRSVFDAQSEKHAMSFTGLITLKRPGGSVRVVPGFICPWGLLGIESRLA